MRASRLISRSDRVEHRPADVVEVDVDAVRAGRPQRRSRSCALVVHAGVEAQLLDDVAALRLAAGDADGPAALDLGDLADDRADRARGRRDDHRLARLAAGRCRAGRRRPSCPACRARPARWRAAPSSGRACAARRRRDAVLLPAPVAPATKSPAAKPGWFELRRPRRPCRPPSARPSSAGAGVRRPVVHPAAHVRVERQVDGAGEELARARLGHRSVLDQGEVLARGSPTGRPFSNTRRLVAMIVLRSQILTRPRPPCNRRRPSAIVRP